MKKTSLSFFAISLMLFLSCSEEASFPDFELQVPSELPSEHYQIINRMLDGFSSTSEIVISQKSSQDIKPEEFFQEEFQLTVYNDLDPQLYSSFEAMNSESILHDNLISVDNKEIQMISDQEISYYFEQNEENSGWNLFRSRYISSNGTYLVLNNISIGGDQNSQAFAGGQMIWSEEVDGSYVTKSSGWLTYLKKTGEEWNAVKTRTFPL